MGAKHTSPQLYAAGKHFRVTWNTSGIDRIATRRMRARRDSGVLPWVNVALCLLVLLALVAMALLLVSYPPF